MSCFASCGAWCWLSCGTNELACSDELVGVEGYDLIRTDRNRNGEGFRIYARSNINYQKRPDLVPNDLEAKRFIC